MCDVPSIAVFCSESIECFPGTASRFFLKLLVTIPVAPIITSMIYIIIIIIIIIINLNYSSLCLGVMHSFIHLTYILIVSLL